MPLEAWQCLPPPLATSLVLHGPPGWAGRLAQAAKGVRLESFLGGLWDAAQAAWRRAEPPRPSDGGQLRAPATGPLGWFSANTAADSVPGGLGEINPEKEASPSSPRPGGLVVLKAGNSQGPAPQRPNT